MCCAIKGEQLAILYIVKRGTLSSSIPKIVAKADMVKRLNGKVVPVMN
jgi:hypothetical protein